MGSLRRNRPLRAFMGYVGLPRLGTARYVLLWSGVAIHLLTIYVGWRLGGWLSAGLSAVFPFAAQAYWILHIWEETDIFFQLPDDRMPRLCRAVARGSVPEAQMKTGRRSGVLFGEGALRVSQQCGLLMKATSLRNDAVDRCAATKLVIHGR